MSPRPLRKANAPLALQGEGGWGGEVCRVLVLLLGLVVMACQEPCPCEDDDIATCRADAGGDDVAIFEAGPDAAPDVPFDLAPDQDPGETIRDAFADVWENVPDVGEVQADGSDAEAAEAGPDADATGPGDAVEAGDTEPDVTPPEPTEVRALWVNRYAFSDAADVLSILDDAAGAGFTDVYFQVRGAFDAYYPSTLEPWATGLTGTLGKDPGWDPLGTALAGAHERGLKLHAWLNVFTLATTASAPTSVGVPHPLKAHPEWRLVDADGTPMSVTDSYVWASPGLAAVRDWNTAVAAEIVALYPDLDGLHLDRIRYPGTTWGYDAESTTGWSTAKATEPGLTFDQYRARQVDAQVAAIHEMLEGIAPQVTLSAAVWGIYANEWGWSSVSLGLAGYLQDPLAWLDAGTIDVVCPMAYWAMTSPKGQRTDFATLADWWLGDEARRPHVLMGLSADLGFDEVADQIGYVRALGGPGVALYTWQTIDQEAGFWSALATGPFAEEP